MKIYIPKLYPHQKLAVESRAMLTLILGGRRSGKSVAINRLFIQALRGLSVALIMPTYAASIKRRDELFQQFREVITHQDLAARRAKTVGGGEFQVFSGDAIDNIRGYQFDIVIVDEASVFRELDLIIKAVMPTILDRKGRMFLVGSYLTGSRFAELFEVENPIIAKFKFLVADNPAIDQATLETMRSLMPAEDYLEEFECIPKLNNQYNFFNWKGAMDSTIPDKHTRLHVSWDFNVGNTNILIGYRTGREIHIIDHIVARDVRHGCELLVLNYPDQVYTRNLVICGDSAGNNRGQLNSVSNYMAMKVFLSASDKQFHPSVARNPFHAESRNYCNAVFATMDVRIPARLSKLVSDINRLAYDPETNEIQKGGAQDPSHTTDALRYLFHAITDHKELFKGLQAPRPMIRDYTAQPLTKQIPWIRNENNYPIAQKLL